MDSKPLKFLSQDEVIAALGIKESMFEEYVESHLLPRGIEWGPKKYVWAQEDLPHMEWLLRIVERMKDMPSKTTKGSEKS